MHHRVPLELPGHFRRRAGHAGGTTFLRVIACGGADCGASRLVERLLCDTSRPGEKGASRKLGTGGDDGNLELPCGLLGEQGSLTGVTWRFFRIEKRNLLVADIPDLEHLTPQSATAVSLADLAVIRVDALSGVVAQTHRHSRIAALLGIRHVLLAIDDIDLVNYDADLFHGIVEDYLAFAEPLKFASVAAIPLSARTGDNIASRSAEMPWYDGPLLLEHLERVEISAHAQQRPFRMPIQRLDRPGDDLCGYSGDRKSVV